MWQASDGGPYRVAAKGAAEAIAELCGLDDAARGMLAADPLRASVPAAIRECHSAGIRVVMISGDYPVTARAIARQAGLEGKDVLDGPSIERMSEAELAAAASRVSVFARIGIAMGGRGTDVAREASSLVLLDDDFGSIVHTIRPGRRIYDNQRKAMAYIIAVHVPIARLALLPLLTGLPLIFGPVHIAFLEMVIDPVCSMVFQAEAAEDDVMKRAPRAATSPLFSPALVVWSLLQGAIAFVPLAALDMLAVESGLPETDGVRLPSCPWYWSISTSRRSIVLLQPRLRSSSAGDPCACVGRSSHHGAAGSRADRASRPCAVPLRAAACRRPDARCCIVVAVFTALEFLKRF